MGFLDSFRRAPNIKKLKRRGDIEGLVEALCCRDLKVQSEAAKALMDLEFRSKEERTKAIVFLVTALVKAIIAEDWHTRELIVIVFQDIGAFEELLLLLWYLEGKPRVPIGADVDISDFLPMDGLDAFTSRLKKDSSIKSLTEQAIAWVFHRLRDLGEPVEEGLAEFVSRATLPSDRIFAAWLIGEICYQVGANRTVKAILRPFLEDKHEEVKKAAREALKKIQAGKI